MPAGNDYCNNPIWNANFHPVSTDAERGLPEKGKIVTRLDASPLVLEICVDTSPDPDIDGGGTWETLTPGTSGLPGYGLGAYGSISWTPTLTATGSSPLDPTLGSGAVSIGYYNPADHFMWVRIRLQFGSGVSAGNDVYQFDLPPVVGLTNPGFPWSLGSGWLRDQNTGAHRVCTVVGGYADGSHVCMVTDDGVVGSNSPWSWSDYDLIDLSFGFDF